MTVDDLKARGFTAVEIPLTRNRWAVIDISDIDYANGRWFTSVCGRGVPKLYAACTRNSQHLRMHRLIMGAKEGQVVDHIDGNSLNNRRGNLRFCTPAENAQSRSRNARRPGKAKGAYFRRGSFYARIGPTHLGVFATEIEAANAYDVAAKERFGEFAKLNQMGKPQVIK